MKIVCVYLCDFIDRDDYYLSLMPYGITSIAAFLEKEGHEVILANLSSYGFSKGAALTAEIEPDAVAVSIFSFNRTESFKYIRELKKLRNKTVIIAGGQHPTFLADEIISRYPEIDYIVKGEGESSIKKIIDNSFTDREKVITSPRISNINIIPYSSLFSGKTIGVNPNEQFKYIITSRGCPSNCTYCSSPYFWEKKVTYRNPDNIVEELIHVQKKYGIIYFSIRDDNFTLNKKRVMEFCHLLESSGIYMMWNCQARVDTIDEEMLIAMKRCGLEHIQFGVESGSEKILKIYDKNITLKKISNAASLTRKVGVYLSYYLMTGMTGETDKDLDKTKNLISSTLPHDVVVSPVAYYPGTKIYSDSVKQGIINNGVWFDTEENGLYLTPVNKTQKNINKLLNLSKDISIKSIYKKNDFIVHKKTAGNDCWMNNIIEGDYFADEIRIEKASDCYNRLISEYPDNIWGYLRMAELIFDKSPHQSLNYFKKASEIVPAYYGVWVRIAQIQFLTGNNLDARQSIQTALKLNPFEQDIVKLAERINPKKSKDY